MSRMLTTSMAANAMQAAWAPTAQRRRTEEPSRADRRMARRAARQAAKARWVGPGGV